MEHGRDDQDKHGQREKTVQGVGEIPHLEQGVPVLHQCGRRAHDHEDGRLCQDRERKSHPESGEIVLGIGQSCDDRRQKRAFRGHHEPGQGQGDPE